MIWLRLIVVIWYSFFVVMAIICLPFFFIVGMCTGDLTLSDSNNSTEDKTDKNPQMKKFLEENTRPYNEK